MPIFWSEVPWLIVSFYSRKACVAAFVGRALSFESRLLCALLSGIASAALYVLWNYYPHGIEIGVSRAGLPPA